MDDELYDLTELRLALAAHEAFIIEKGLANDFEKFTQKIVNEFLNQKRKETLTLVK